jgi:hypothetical protein
MMTEEEFLGLTGQKSGVPGVAAPKAGQMSAPEPVEHSAPSAAVAGFGQGISSGWTDELGAAVDTGLSKLPGPLARAAESANAAGGGHPGLSPLTAPLTLDQRIAEYRARNAEMRQQHPVASGAGQVAGTVAQAFAPVLGAARAPTLAGSAASGALQGAGAGAGFNENPDTLGAETLRGAGVGAALGAAGYGVQKYMAGAPARNDARQLNDLGVTPKDAGKSVAVGGEVKSNADDLLSLVRRDPGLRAGAGNPKAIVAATAKGMEPLAQETAGIYAKAGEMPLADLKAGLDAVTAANATAPTAYLNRVKAAGKQLEALAGGTSNVGAKQVREFITSRLAPTATESQNGSAQAVNDAAVALKDVLRGHVGTVLGPEAASRLAAAEKDISLYKRVEGAALRQVDKATFAVPTPQPLRSAKRGAQAAVDAAAGVRVPGGRTAGSVVASGVGRMVGQRVTEALAAGKEDDAHEAVRDGIFGP